MPVVLEWRPKMLKQLWIWIWSWTRVFITAKEEDNERNKWITFFDTGEAIEVFCGGLSRLYGSIGSSDWEAISGIY